MIGQGRQFRAEHEQVGLFDGVDDHGRDAAQPAAGWSGGGLASAAVGDVCEQPLRPDQHELARLRGQPGQGRPGQFALPDGIAAPSDLQNTSQSRQIRRADKHVALAGYIEPAQRADHEQPRFFRLNPGAEVCPGSTTRTV